MSHPNPNPNPNPKENPKAKRRMTNFILIRRVFFENGYRSIAALANAAPQDLVPILMQVQVDHLQHTGSE